MPKFKIIKKAFITRAFVRAHPDYIFLFGDNLIQRGLGGQAKEMRGEFNAIGIPTKKQPSNADYAFFSDIEYKSNIKAIDKAFMALDKYSDGTILILPSAGLGTGLADLENKAPFTFKYLRTKLINLGK